MTQPTEPSEQATELAKTVAKTRTMAETLGVADLAGAAVEVTWHSQSDEQVKAIVAAFPEATWKADGHGSGTQWLRGYLGNGVRLVVFLAHDGPIDDKPLRALQILTEAKS